MVRCARRTLACPSPAPSPPASARAPRAGFPRDGPAPRRSAARRNAPSISSRSGTTISAAADGVGARTSAAKSASVTSTSWPTPHTTGSGWATTARTTRSSLNAHRSSSEPPPRARIVSAGASSGRPASTIAEAYRATRRNAVTMLAGAPSPWTWAPTSTTWTSGQRRRSTWPTSRHTAPDGLVITAIVRGRVGNGRFRAESNSPSSASRALSASNRRARSPTPAGWIEST